jgi:hypothetical protein
MFNPYGLLVVGIGILLVFMGWRNTYKEVGAMLKGK